MRMIALMGTAAAALTAATLLAAPASADRVCRKSCDDGFCRTRCIESRDRLYMHDRDSYWHHRHGPGIGIHGPGVDVDVRR
jgi:hypothetical protein